MRITKGNSPPRVDDEIPILGQNDLYEDFLDDVHRPVFWALGVSRDSVRKLRFKEL